MIASYALKNRAVTLVFMFLILAGGLISFDRMGRLEDPEFTIKEAVIYTQYPGATAKEVEKEITEPLETGVQQLKQLKEVRSISRAGLSIIFAEIQDTYDKDTLPQVWDELRRKVNDSAGGLPPGSYTPIINDDFGDVYGIFFAITGDGYTQKELQEFAEDLRRELLLSDDVGRIDFWGFQQEVVYVETDRTRMARLGIAPTAVFSTISEQNSVVDSGRVKAGNEEVKIRVSGDYNTVEDIGEQLISGGSGTSLIRIKDIASVERGFIDPPTNLLRFNGEDAVGLGISVVAGGNVVTMGASVKERLAELEARIPVGISIEPISYQADTVDASVNGFLVNLAEAVGIVVLLLVIFMGLREGIIIGVVLLLTILATFIGMLLFDVNLQRISLGALVIALGMLVDNAIVVAEGFVIKRMQGLDAHRSATETVRETQWPLLGATVIAILAFAAISVSRDVTGEFLGSLFQVIALSLSISWIMAVTVVPYLCVTFLATGNNEFKQPYQNRFFNLYRSFLTMCIRHRYATIMVVVAMLGAAVYGFGSVKQNFFPGSTRAQFMVDITLPENSHIETTANELKAVERYVSTLEGVTDISAFVGSGALRFILTYAPEMINSGYGQLLVSVDDYRKIDGLIPEVRNYLQHNHPNAVYKVEGFRLGPGGTAIAARFNGADSTVLRQLSEQAKQIMRAHGNTTTVSDDWGERVKVAAVNMAQARSDEIGVSRSDIAASLALSFSGSSAGLYREGEDLLPIVVRLPENQRRNIESIDDVMVYSSAIGRFIPIGQVTDGSSTRWEDAAVHRLNRIRTITVSCEQQEGTATDLFNELRPLIEGIELPEGYTLEWGGEYEDSTEANRKLMSKVPLAFAMMFFISVMLFNTLRHPIIIFLGLPLAIIGVTGGLLIMDVPFGFMSLLGFLSLSGMLMKNEIVLLDQINIEREKGTPPFQAVVESAVSRVRPVSLAAFTTVLGMVPLLWDAFFNAMAVTIMGGLTFATVLTLIVVPVLYATFFGIHEGKTISRKATEKKTSDVPEIAVAAGSTLGSLK